MEIKLTITVDKLLDDFKLSTFMNKISKVIRDDFKIKNYTLSINSGYDLDKNNKIYLD